MAECKSAEEVWKESGYCVSDKSMRYPVAYGILSAKVDCFAREIERYRKQVEVNPERACKEILNAWDICMEDILK